MKRSPLVTLRRHEIEIETRCLRVHIGMALVSIVIGGLMFMVYVVFALR